jgi:hypothetical protein
MNISSMSQSLDEFRAVIRGLNLPAENAKNIEVKIRQVVLDEIARLELKGDYVIRKSGSESSKGEKQRTPFPPGLRGIVIDPRVAQE